MYRKSERTRPWIIRQPSLPNLPAAVDNGTPNWLGVVVHFFYSLSSSQLESTFRLASMPAFDR